MKRVLFLFGLIGCLLFSSFPGFANETEAAKEEYKEAISENWKKMLKGSIRLDTMNAENNTHLLEWQDVEDPPKEADALVEQIEKLMKQQEADQESMDPYTKAKKACDEKMNADGANAALENIIRIQEDRIEDQKELSKLWDQVEKLLK